MASTRENEGHLIEEVSLIDILYKDEYRVDSYLAQIMKTGVLKRSKVQETNSQTDTKEIGGSLPIISGRMADNGTTTVMEENRFIPHDHNVNTLLDILNLEPQEILTDEKVTGRVVCLKGRLAIRDFRRFAEIISVMADNSELFKVNKEDFDNIKKTFEIMFKIMPVNIEVEFVLKDNSVVRGILQEKYLLTAYQDIVATHGTQQPGTWYTVGILDSLNQSKQPLKLQGFRKSLDVLSSIAGNLYREDNPRYTITPFLIFRGLEK